MRSVGLTATCPPVLAASAGLLLVTMIGCSFNRGSSDVTTVVFDGDQYTIEEPVSCGVQPDGINSRLKAHAKEPRTYS
jgi:hypothetical protein